MRSRWNKGRSAILFGFVSLGLFVVACLTTQAKKPEYRSKNVDYWFEAIIFDSPEGEQAKAAFAAMGSSTVSFLLSQVQADVPSFKERAAEWFNTKVRHQMTIGGCGLERLSVRDQRLNRLAVAFAALGDSAKPAVKKLGSLLRNPACSRDAAYCLAAIGPAAMDEMALQFKSQDLSIRRNIASMLGEMTADKTNACKLAMKALNDSDPLVRLYAAASVGELQIPIEECISRLTTALRDPDARVRYICLYALKKFGTPASSALPVIHTLENDPLESVRSSAVEIAQHIESLSSGISSHVAPNSPN